MINLSTFKGEAPRIAPRALPNEMSVTAINPRLLSADLDAYTDISDIHVLGKSGPINTIYLYDGPAEKDWFCWPQSDIDAANAINPSPGFVNVDVARVPIVGDTTVRTVFTGVGPPQITNQSLAINPDVGPYGPYPDGSSDLAVLPPTLPVTVTNTPGSTADVSTVIPTGGYITDMTGWTQYAVSFGGVSSLTSGGHATIPLPCYDFLAQQSFGTYASITGGFGFANSDGWSVVLNTGSTDGGDLTEDQNVRIQVCSDGNGMTPIGPELFLGFTSTNTIVWTDKAAAGSPVTTFPFTTPSPSAPIQVSINTTGKNVIGGITSFTCLVTLTNITTNTVIGAPQTVTATVAGDLLSLASSDGENPGDTGHVYFGNIVVTMRTRPVGFVPVFSNYVFTMAGPFQLESAPSPVSNTVQVDNNNIDTISFPDPTVSNPTQDVRELFLYRAASGASGTEYLQVANGLYVDGGFPLCVVGGTADAITLTDLQDAFPSANTSYLFKALHTNLTTAVTIAVDGSPAYNVVDTAGNPLASGAIVLGSNYTAIYQRAVSLPATGPAPAHTSTVFMSDTSMVLAGMPVSDEQGCIPPNTMVGVVTPNVSIELAELGSPLVPVTLGSDMVTGDLLTFSPFATVFTLLDGYTYVDITPTADLGIPLASADFDLPPDNMQGILAMPNQYLVGFEGTSLIPSVVGQPQGYPLNYRLATDSPIVGIAAVDTNIVAFTADHPYTAWGTDPSALQMSKEEFSQGCTSKRSISYLRGYGAIFGSTDGIYAYAGLGQIRSLTKQLFTIKEWKPLNPSSIIGIVHQGMYYFWYDATSIGGIKGGYILDPDPDGFGLVELDFHAIAAYVNAADDTLYLVIDQGAIEGGGTPADNELLQWDGGGAPRPYVWRSKLYQMPYRTWLSICRVRAASYVGLVFKLYDNGVLYSTFTPTSDVEFTLPEPPTGDAFAFQIEGTTAVQTVQFCERAEELM